MITNKIKLNIRCFVISLSVLICGAFAMQAQMPPSDSNENCIFCVAQVEADNKYQDLKVYAGGMPFGVRFKTSEVTIVKTNSFISGGKEVSPAADAGITENDVITEINGQKVESVTQIIDSVKNSSEFPIVLTIKRDSRQLQATLTPKICDESGEYRLGILLKDSSAGIGTVTFIRDDALAFAGLGHGICDSSSGKVIPIETGYVSYVKINGINKGKAGAPGELRGTFEENKCGKLLSNTEVGVYGIFTEKPKQCGKSVEVAEKDEVQIGDATILCTLDGNGTKEYKIEIAEINHDQSAKTKNFVVKVCDPVLLEKTGGIVQGMSGSPILQNGKIIGAITHVMINDPTTGYGIYIGNMLDEMEKFL